MFNINKYILICVICTIMAILVPIIGHLLLKQYNPESVNEMDYPVSAGDYEEYTLESQKMILKTGIEGFKELNLDNKKMVLETLAKVELNRLGCNNVKIEFKSISDSNDAETNVEKRVISINQKRLMDSNIDAKILFTAVLHEVRHQYQWDCIRCYINASPNERRLLIFKDCEAWVDAAYNYIYPHKIESDYEEQLKQYKNNALEEDANLYATERYLEYCKELSIGWNY